MAGKNAASPVATFMAERATANRAQAQGEVAHDELLKSLLNRLLGYTQAAAGMQCNEKPKS